MGAVRRTLHGLPGPLLADALRGFDEHAAKIANRHGLAAFVNARAVHGALAPGVSRTLAQGVVVTARSAHLVGAAFVRAHRALADAGVPAIALKGPSLARRLWGAPELRPSSDVDVLVRRADLERALLVLDPAGYAISDRSDPVHDLEAHHHLELADRQGGAVVELHFVPNVALGARFDSEAIFARARPDPGSPAPALVMAPEDELVYLALHAAAHAFTPAVQVLDLKLRVRAGVDGALVRERAREAGVEVAVGAAMRIMRRLTGEALREAEDGVRATAAATVLSDALLLSGLLGDHKRLTYATNLLLTDSPVVAGRVLAHQARHGFARRLRDAWRLVRPVP